MDWNKTRLITVLTCAKTQENFQVGFFAMHHSTVWAYIDDYFNCSTSCSFVVYFSSKSAKVPRHVVISHAVEFISAVLSRELCEKFFFSNNSSLKETSTTCKKCWHSSTHFSWPERTVCQPNFSAINKMFEFFKQICRSKKVLWQKFISKSTKLWSIQLCKHLFIVIRCHSLLHAFKILSFWLIFSFVSFSIICFSLAHTWLVDTGNWQ